MAGYIERLKKLLGWFKGSKLHPPIATKVIDGDAEGDFITLSDKQVKDIQGTNNQPSNAPWTADPAEIHIGLDFGTSYTKACLYFLDKDQRHVVRWNTSWGSEKGYFLPSRLWLDSDNVLHMVMPSAKQSREIRYIKMAVAGGLIGPRILPVGIMLSSDPYRIYSAFYIARCLDWIEQHAADLEPKYLRNKEIVWSGNIGIPISYFETKALRNYLEILTAARYMQNKVSDSESMERLDSLYKEAVQESFTKTFLPVPELYAEACGLFSDYHTPEGYYTLFDVGGGTVDGAVMRFERVAGEPQVNFLTASVQPLGAEVFKANQDNSQRMRDLQKQLGCQTAELIMDAKLKAQADWRSHRNLPIEMCGGGHASKSHVNTISSTYFNRQHGRCGIPPYKVEDLKAQISGVDGIRPGDEHRLLIAIGLSIPEGQGPLIQGFPHQNPKNTPKLREKRIDLDDLQRELYGG